MIDAPTKLFLYQPAEASDCGYPSWGTIFHISIWRETYAAGSRAQLLLRILGISVLQRLRNTDLENVLGQPYLL